jgi:hypothetical protein
MTRAFQFPIFSLVCRIAFLFVIAAVSASSSHAQTVLPSYRGFSLAATYREFAERARTLARGEPLTCRTSRRTAQLMECGLVIKDPADSASFRLSAFILEGRVAQMSFGDSGAAVLVDRMKRELTTRFGQPRATGQGTWEWRAGRQVARLNWRGRGTRRWVFFDLRDDAILGAIAKYRPRTRPPGPTAPAR